MNKWKCNTSVSADPQRHLHYELKYPIEAQIFQRSTASNTNCFCTTIGCTFCWWSYDRMGGLATKLNSYEAKTTTQSQTKPNCITWTFDYCVGGGEFDVFSLGFEWINKYNMQKTILQKNSSKNLSSNNFEGLFFNLKLFGFFGD